MSIKIENVMSFVSELIEEYGDKKFNKVWKKEKKEEMEKMLKKLVAKAKKSVKPKKVKDPEAPKKKSAWLLFCEAERPKIKAEMNLKPKEVFAELGKRWEECKENEKEKVKELQEAAKVSKDEYVEKMKIYVPKEGVKVEKKKKKKDKNAPKGARSAWIFFCEAERKKMAKEKKKRNGKETIVELGERWKEIKKTKKGKKFEDLAKEDKKRHDKEMENYNPPESEDEAEESDKESDSEDEEEEEKPKAKKTAKKTAKKEESEDEEEEEMPKMKKEDYVKWVNEQKKTKKKVEIVETEDEESDSDEESDDE